MSTLEIDRNSLLIGSGTRLAAKDIHPVEEAQRLRTALVLTCLVLQNTGLVLATKFTYRKEAEPYDPASVILTSELVKFAICYILERRNNLSSLVRGGQGRFLRFSSTNVAMLFPACLYVVQNNLTFYAIKGLSPAVYVVCSQLKIVTSACFSVVLLKAVITARRAQAIVLLTVGVMVVQWPGDDSKEKTLAGPDELKYFIALTSAVTISGLSGAVLEKSFKKADESLWAKNFYLSGFSIPFAFLSTAHNGSYFHGYDAFVMLVVLLQALGGLLTAAVMRHAGVVAKCFAVALSTVLCTVLGSLLNFQVVSNPFIFGAVMVNAAVFMFFTD